MDIKTLEYMGTRVDKARKLQDKIVAIDDRLAVFTNKNTREISLNIEGNGNYSLSNIVPIQWINFNILPAIIDALTKRRDQLQKELDEL